MSVLLSKAQADLTRFAGEDRHSEIHVTETYAEATNGHIAVRVSHDGLPVGDFPTVPGMGNGAGEMLIPSAALEKAAKAITKRNRIPVCNYIHAGQTPEGKIALTTHDLESPSVSVSSPGELSSYPKIDKVIPTAKPKLTVRLGAALLRDLAAYAAKHGPRYQPSLTFHFVNGSDAVRIDIALADGGTALAILMPMTLHR